MDVPTRVSVVVAQEEPWVGRSFLKDAKLRASERYWRPLLLPAPASAGRTEHGEEGAICLLEAVSSSAISSTATLLLPDALTWRKYLRLIRRIGDLCGAAATVADDESKEAAAADPTFLFQWILTESATELLDHRNQSLREAAAPQERSLLQRFVLEESSDNNNSHSLVVALADLSVRENAEDDENGGGGVDEWDLLQYPSLNLTERSRQALVRAGNLLNGASSLLRRNDNNSNSGSQPSCWLVVDDDNARLPLDEDDTKSANMKYVSMDQIIDAVAKELKLSMEKAEGLRQLKQVCEEEYERRNAPADDTIQDAIETVLTEEEIRKRLQTGQLLRGRLNVTRDNVREAFVTTSGRNQTFFIQFDHFNRAFHQDMVLIEPLPESQWGRPVGRRRLVHQSDNNDENDTDAAALDHHLATTPTVPSARVVAIDQPTRRVFVATMTGVPHSTGEGAVLVIPMDPRIPKIRIRTRSWQRFVGVRLKVEIVDWDADSNYPTGHCVKILGPIGDLETEIGALLIENQVELDPFSTGALACLPVEGSDWRVTEDQVQQRKDLRTSRRVFSVDPPGCQDIDDTMHAEVLPNGDVEVGVHIADVTHFVKHTSRLDIEAQVRGTTFYLVDRRFDMLPSLLSSNLCSLHNGVDRLAVSVIWTLSSDLLEVKSTWFGRTVIHNCAAMTYDQADNILHNKSPEEPGAPLPPPLTAGSPVDPHLIESLQKDLGILTQLARKLRKQREEIGGAVDLSSGDDSGSELKFTLDGNGNPTKVVPKQDKEIHHTIAELMIMANTHVAARIHDFFPDSALLRIHRSVEDSRFEELREVLEAAGVTLEGNDSTSLAKSLKEAQKKSRAENSPFQSLLLSVATRAMTEAQYICTGDREDGVALSHYGLGLEKYTHFTSPIRRYADVVVHKQLLASLAMENAPVDKAKPRTSQAIKLDPLSSIPDSNVVSILGGEGLTDKREVSTGEDDNLLIDFLTEGACDTVLDSDPPDPPVPSLDEEAPPEERGESVSFKPYDKVSVSRICEGLNLHNRLAKHSSYECQGLFLSLYFKEHAEKTAAVVTNLRENGFYCYVPKFDVKGPVYIRDINGDVQMDPSLLGLKPDAGLAPTMGFAASGICRRFPDGKCELFDDGPDARLEVKVGEAATPFTIRPFDVVDIELTCDNWDVRARVPSPRLQLLSSRASSAPTTSPPPAHVEITFKALNRRNPTVESAEKTDREFQGPSLFDVVSDIPIQPLLPDPIRCIKRSGQQTPDRKETMKGRIILGDFQNPDTRSAVQEVALQAASAEAAQRRANMLEASSRRSEYDTFKSVERNVTMRQQRLAADKRNTRRSKGK